MKRRDIILALHTSDGIGWLTIKRLMEHTEIMQLPYMEAMDIHGQSGIGLRKATIIANQLREHTVVRTKEEYNEYGIQWLVHGEADYPRLLIETPWAPWVLFYKGNIQLLQRLCVGMVGTRVPTTYGRRTAERLSSELAERGVTVVSGLARGIDSHAHRGALTGPGSTVAVMAADLTHVYPPENRTLFKQIEQEGLIISEAPLGTALKPGLFPLRNRIIAGISMGTVVVEGGLGSGSLITAELSLDISREVFAIPGPITSPKSEGPLSLIRDGGKLVTTVQDILEEFKFMVEVPAKSSVEPLRPALTEDENKIIKFLQDGTVNDR